MRRFAIQRVTLLKHFPNPLRSTVAGEGRKQIRANVGYTRSQYRPRRHNSRRRAYRFQAAWGFPARTSLSLLQRDTRRLARAIAASVGICKPKTAACASAIPMVVFQQPRGPMR